MASETESLTESTDSKETELTTESGDLVRRFKSRSFGLNLSIGLVGFGLILGIIITVLDVVPEMAWQILSVFALTILVIGILGVFSLFRLSNTQRYYLNLIEYEKSELGEYLEVLKDDKYLDTSNVDVDIDVTKRCVRAGINQLERAKCSVYREDYVSFMSTYYRANAQRIFIYAHLDAVNTSNGSRRVDWSFDLDLQELPDRHVREEGTIEVPQSDESRTRLWNLTRWLWLISRSLPEAERNEVDDYLLGPDKKLKQSQSPQTLYRALSVVDTWDIQRLAAFMTIKRGLRLLIPVLTVLLIVTIAIMIITDTAISELTLNAGPDESPAVLGSPWFSIPIVVAGIVGSIFSMALFMHDASKNITSDRSIPNPKILPETIGMSVLIGGISALIIYVLLLSEVGSVIFSEDIRFDPLSLLFVAFLSGYSELFVRRSLEKAESQIGKNTENGIGTPDGEISNEQRRGEP